MQDVRNIGIVGSGVVGSAIGKVYRLYGHNVLFYDINKIVLETLKSQSYQTTEDIQDVVSKCDIIFVCVPTPTVIKKQEQKNIMEACEALSEAFKKLEQKTTMYKIKTLCIKSTVLPGTTDKIIRPMFAKYNVKVCFYPEFLRAAFSIRDALNPDKTVLGCRNEDKIWIASELNPLLIIGNSTTFIVDTITAEMCKYAANLFLATKISYFNKFGEYCNRVGADSQIIGDIMKRDRQVGPYGVMAGKAYSGMCLVKDMQAFISWAEANKMDTSLLNDAKKINDSLAGDKKC